MVFEWVTSKFKERQLRKAQIQAEADHMVIVSGMSIINPTWRMFFKHYPFYDTNTDSIDFKKLDSYIRDLRSTFYAGANKKCNDCWYKKCNENFFSDLNEITHSTYKEVILDYRDRKELERLRQNEFNKGYDDVDWILYKELQAESRQWHQTKHNFENKIYQKNKEIERLQTLLDEKSVKEVVKVIEKEPVNDSRPVTRGSKIYNKFKMYVLKRDEVCQCCGSTENLHVHHLSSYKHDKTRRADTSNGIVLCEECHQQYHSLYGKEHKNNPVNFAKFMREYGKPMQVNLDYAIEMGTVGLGGK